MACILRIPAALGYALLFTLLLISNNSFAQNISGIVNQYEKVTYVTSSGSNTSKVVVTTNVFAPNDKVMIMQMKGATVTAGNVAAFGTVTVLNGAGWYEFGIVKSVIGDTVVLKGPLCHNYSVPDSVQLIKVATYTSKVTVTGTLTCAPWANGVGGVLVIDAADTLVLQADVDVSFKGFLGGNQFGTAFNCNASDYAVSSASNADGEKGEGVAQYISGSESGRAPSANGGGGAGAGNAAAGGGANYGAGGNGGSEYDGCGGITSAFVGYGGYALPYTASRLFMGGGGGGPQHDNGYPVFKGGAGGAIILIRAKAIAGNNYTMRSNGDSIARTHDEGTSGAGAGGTVYLVCNNYSSKLNIVAVGGRGGDVYNTAFPTNCHPPSGGGGGGGVWLSSPSTPASVFPQVDGGATGLVLNPASPCYNTSDNATPGAIGGVLYNLPNVFFYPQQNLGDTILCSSGTVTFGLDTGYASYLWSTGAATAAITVSQFGSYYVQAITPLGCTFRDTENVKADTLFLGNDTTVCNNILLTLRPKPLGNFTAYLWQDGSVLPTYQVRTTGEYKVTVTTIHGCRLTDSIHVTVLTKPLLRDTVLCTDRIPVTLSLPGGYTSYQWSTGATSPSITVSTSGTYTVHAVTRIGCIIDDTSRVLVDSSTLGKDLAVCSDTGVILTPQVAANIVSYLWQDSTTASTFRAKTTGEYFVHVTTVHSCVIKDSVHVLIDTMPSLSFTFSDSALCEGKATLFTAHYTTTGDTSLIWNFGDNTIIRNETQLQHGYNAPGDYLITLTARYRLCPDTTYKKAFTVNGYPVVNLGPDTSICPNGSAITISDNINAGNPNAMWLWNTGDTTSSISATTDGRYSTVVTVNGCSTADSIDVFKNCYLNIPNVFSPNNDGVNDYFFPRQLLGKGVVSFTMDVYDRWGLEIFQTHNIDGRGWDGKYNGANQPEGVYIYVIQVQFQNGETQTSKGNVTLLR